MALALSLSVSPHKYRYKYVAVVVWLVPQVYAHLAFTVRVHLSFLSQQQVVCPRARTSVCLSLKSSDSNLWFDCTSQQARPGEDRHQYLAGSMRNTFSLTGREGTVYIPS